MPESDAMENINGSAPPNDPRGALRAALFQAAPLLVLYFGARACGAPPYIALTAVIVASAAVNLASAVRKRRFEPNVLIALLLAAGGLVVAASVKNVRLMQAVDTIPWFLLMLALLGGALLRKPLTKKAVGFLVPGAAAGNSSTAGWTERDERAWDGLHLRLSVVCALVILASNLAMLAVIFTLSADVSQILILVIPGVSALVMALYAAFRIRTFSHRRDGRAPAQEPGREARDTARRAGQTP